MKLEIFISFAIVVILVAFLTIIIFIVGLPFNLNLKFAYVIAAYILVVLLPGGMNLWDAACSSDWVERMTSGIRGVVLIVGWTSFGLAIASKHKYSYIFPWITTACIVIFAWSIWRIHRHRIQK
jgi:hypothetical protein